MNNDYKYLPIVGNTPIDIEQVTSTQVIEGDFFKNITQPKGKPKTAIMPKTKAQETVFSGNTGNDVYTLDNIGIDNDQFAWNVGRLITGNSDVVTPISIKSQQFILAEGTVVDLEKKLTPYDMAVHDAICTLCDSGRTLVTTRQIAESMTGQRCESKGVLSAVTRSINKMRMTLIDIDYTAHLKACGVETEGGNSIIKDSNIIQAESFKNVDINGQTVAQAWKITAEPVLFTYAKEINQVASCPMQMLNVPVDKNERNIVLLRRLVREIETMKNRSTYSRTLKFDTIFSKCAFTDISAKTYRTLRDTILRILDDWTDTHEYIKGYKTKSNTEVIAVKKKGKPLKKVKGKSITGVEIIL